MSPEDRTAMDADDREPQVVVTLSDEVPDAHREAIRVSVAEMARRSAATSQRTVEGNREHTELAKRLSAPLKKLIEDDDDAAAALTAEQAEARSADPEVRAETPDWPAVTFVPGDIQPSSDTFAAHQAFGAPWHYQWQWHVGQPPQRSLQDRPNGRLELGVHVDQNSNWSDSHGGFGVALTSDRVQSVAARSLRRSHYRYFVHGGSLGGNATAEGGMEMTALEGGRLLSSARDKRFRRRLGSGEREEYDEPGWETGQGIQVDWVMLPGRVYTLNVGCWIFCEAHGGIGTASIGQASLEALVIVMTADFTD